jgi:hypothetical protein
MKKHPVQLAKRSLRRAESKLPVVHEPAPSAHPFLSFRYSYTEVSAAGRGARVKASHARYEDGRLTTEQFEGELDRDVYERVVRDAQHRFLDQWGVFLRSFSRLLP